VSKTDYTVVAGILELPDGHCFEVGNSEWWEWLNSEEAKSFRFECDFGVKSYGARKETIKSRSGSFWYGYKRIDGKLRKRYLGKSNELTLERLESIAYDLAKPAEPKPEELPNTVGNSYDQLLLQKLRLEQRVKELEELPNKLPNNEELKQLQYRCVDLQNENNRLRQLGQEYSHETFATQREKYEKLLQEARHWRESSESYQRQAAKLRAELDELHNTLGNQQQTKPTSLEGIKRYKLHGRDVVRVEDLEGL
jgi:hypothetical protein